jgi:chaperone required for assembly of F1-ATPase
VSEESDASADPVQAAQRPARPTLPKRFYKDAGVVVRDGLHALSLDGRTARTPARRLLAVADRAVAEGLAAEWQAQATVIDPGTMPLTRLVNAAIDRVAEEMPAVRAEIVKYAGTDLLCYRAEGPESLVERQNAAWEPLLAWAEAALGARFVLAEGIVHVPQRPETLAAVAAPLETVDALRLAALHTVTTLTGSAVIALALWRGAIGREAAWAAAHVDEDWQMELWGRDELALARRAARAAEMRAAALVLGAG